MDTSYAKFGIQTAQQFDTALSDEDQSFRPPSIHVHDIGHNIKMQRLLWREVRIVMGVFPMMLMIWQ